MSILDWLVWCSGGVILGIFPMWWWCSAMVIYSVVYETKQVPRLILSAAKNSPGLGLFDTALFQKPYYLTMMRILAIAWVVACLAILQYAALVNYARDNISRVIMIETSALPFLLLTWLIPSYFLRHYLQKTKIKEGEIMRISSPGKQRRTALSFTLLAALMAALLIYVSWGQPLFSIKLILNILMLGILFYFAILVNVRTRRRNQNDLNKHKE